MATLFMLALAAPVLAGDPYIPGASEFSAIADLSTAQTALAELQNTDVLLQRRIHLRSAISALTRLYQLHGCEWALVPLKEAYSDPDCPDFRMGYSADGRIGMAIEPLDLRNPVFAEYQIYLVTLESNSSNILRAETAGELRFQYTGGQLVKADYLDEGHPLWPKLAKLAGSFQPVAALYPGSGSSFKQLFRAVEFNGQPLQAVLFTWGDYSLNIPVFEYEVESD